MGAGKPVGNTAALSASRCSGPAGPRQTGSRDHAPIEGGTSQESRVRLMPCAHIDAIGFGLENFDAVGKWQTHEEARGFDASGTLTSGESFDGAARSGRDSDQREERSVCPVPDQENGPQRGLITLRNGNGERLTPLNRLLSITIVHNPNIALKKKRHQKHWGHEHINRSGNSPSRHRRICRDYGPWKRPDLTGGSRERATTPTLLCRLPQQPDEDGRGDLARGGSYRCRR